MAKLASIHWLWEEEIVDQTKLLERLKAEQSKDSNFGGKLEPLF